MKVELLEHVFLDFFDDLPAVPLLRVLRKVSVHHLRREVLLQLFELFRFDFGLSRLLLLERVVRLATNSLHVISILLDLNLLDLDLELGFLLLHHYHTLMDAFLLLPDDRLFLLFHFLRLLLNLEHFVLEEDHFGLSFRKLILQAVDQQRVCDRAMSIPLQLLLVRFVVPFYSQESFVELPCQLDHMVPEVFVLHQGLVRPQLVLGDDVTFSFLLLLVPGLQLLNDLYVLELLLL